jgi:hypothetical protein
MDKTKLLEHAAALQAEAEALSEHLRKVLAAVGAFSLRVRKVQEELFARDLDDMIGGACEFSRKRRP